MTIQKKTKLNIYSKLLLKYIHENWILSLVFFYMIASILINLKFDIDIMIPCLWKSIFNVECPACGLTRSAVKLSQFNFRGAYAQNPLIFIVIPVSIYFILKDFLIFLKRYSPDEKNQTDE